MEENALIANVKEKLKENKKLRLGCMIAAAVILIAIIVALVMCFKVHWVRGGTDSSGPFRYGQHFGGSCEVRIDTRNLPDGEFALVNADTDTVRIEDQGRKGKEQVYRISKIPADSPFMFSAALYKDETARENDEALYRIEISFYSDEDGKVDTLYAQARDIKPVTHLDKDEYTFSYQIMPAMDDETAQEVQALYVQISNAYYHKWKISCDETLLTADEFYYYDQGEAYAMVTPKADQTGEFETDVTVYLDETADDGTEGTKLVLHVKGGDGAITEVTQADE